MEKIFYVEPDTGLEKTYAELFQDISNTTTYSLFCKSSSFYEVSKQIVLSLVLGKEITLLDSDFSTEETSRLVGDVSVLDAHGFVELGRLTNFESLKNCIEKNKDKWSITIFTSGTTGLPKKVSHSFDSITRTVHTGEKHVDDIWGFAYNTTHMAGLQVFFQAFLNQNTIVRLFQYDRENIFQAINKYNITHISSTPTFYRLLLPVEQSFNNVFRLTSGGEKFDKQTLEQLKLMFPSAKITNVYASTEAGSLFASKDEIFKLKEEWYHLVKIEQGELFVHKQLMGLFDSKQIEGDWYSTEDLVEVLSENPLSFRFISRNSEMINVGGYKVNPNEIEDTIRSIEGVQDVFVYGKPNKVIGNIVCCDVIREEDSLTELQILNFLRGKIQEFKIPRIIKFVDKLKITRTGKVSRKI